MVQQPEFDEFAPWLFQRIALCVGSPHFQVAERALFLWNNEYIVSLIAAARDKILPVVFDALYTNSRQHWNSTVHGLTCNVVKLFMEMDSKLFDEVSGRRSTPQSDYNKEKDEKWERVRAKAQRACPKEFQAWEERQKESTRVSTEPEQFDAEAMQRALEKRPFDGLKRVSQTPTSDYAFLKRKSVLPPKSQ